VFSGVLFFPVTPFSDDGSINLDVFSEHIERQLGFAPGGVFLACGTGEFSALSLGEYEQVVQRGVAVIGRRLPVYAGAGGQLATAIQQAHAAQSAGVDGLLLMPPYLVTAPRSGIANYVRAVCAATTLPIILYSRANAVLDVSTAVELAQLDNVVGFKDGSGDIEMVARIVSAVRESLGQTKEFSYFNGLPTAEVTVPAYRAIGVPLYSSAVFCFAAEIAAAFYRAVTDGDDSSVDRLLRTFYHPLVELRNTTPGYAVSLVKAGVRLRGLNVGSVRPPLIDPTPQHLEQLAKLVDAGLAILR
jgi:5-dehydro-4-deoxyglucarate dehydratase